MGTVWLAERADGLFRQRVAVKLMRAGLLGDIHRRRFEAERRILGRLDHPGIARILDGGVGEGGQPYLVMEYVEGEPVTDYCARKGLSVEARLALVRAACEAVAYAHRNLVVHRDLKPSNLLVTEDGAVKLLDFGIAKLLDTPEEDGGEGSGPLTLTGSLVMTPEYAAPEQVTGAPVTPATDVYALGVLLFELLTGTRPYRVEGRSPSAIEAAICQTPPTRPSAAIREPGERGGRARAQARAARRLRGDLDTIVLKALRKEPERRYASAGEMGEDLRRHAEGLPVSARPDTAGYRVRKFVGRHRAGVAASAAVLLALVVGLGAALAQARVAERERDRAERRFEIARETARTLLYDVDDALAAVPGTTEAREVLVRQSLDYLDRLSEEAGDDLPLRLDIAHAYLRAGNVLGNPNSANLGSLDAAAARYRQGLSLLPGSLPPGHPQHIDALWASALLQEKLAQVEASLGRPDSAVALLQRTFPLYRAYAEANPEGRGTRVLPIAHILLGDYTGHPDHPNVGDRARSQAHYDTVLVLLEGLPPARRRAGAPPHRACLRAPGHPPPGRRRLRRSPGRLPALLRDAAVPRSSRPVRPHHPARCGRRIRESGPRLPGPREVPGGSGGSPRRVRRVHPPGRGGRGRRERPPHPGREPPPPGRPPQEPEHARERPRRRPARTTAPPSTCSTPCSGRTPPTSAPANWRSAPARRSGRGHSPRRPPRILHAHHRAPPCPTLPYPQAPARDHGRGARRPAGGPTRHEPSRDRSRHR
jgi:eukaryotic-like serine/threonine-protein kinase